MARVRVDVKDRARVRLRVSLHKIVNVAVDHRYTYAGDDTPIPITYQGIDKIE